MAGAPIFLPSSTSREILISWRHFARTRSWTLRVDINEQRTRMTHLDESGANIQPREITKENCNLHRNVYPFDNIEPSRRRWRICLSFLLNVLDFDQARVFRIAVLWRVTLAEANDVSGMSVTQASESLIIFFFIQRSHRAVALCW